MSDVTLKFSKDVYEKSFEDFKDFVKSKNPKVTVSQIKDSHKNRKPILIKAKDEQDNKPNPKPRKSK